ncbi:MAG: phosphoribosylformylglycinamidine synthase subunit PurQ [Actinobacteria bacterium]|nr:phosphoribosylformylglycinamidine synthase subunit PurQ [Actinomycetota bacterium]MCL5445011.1 phosphoribosylformylglycinamidine synthase subunit PurQ [Actinomycetota bacterium]
MPPTVGVVVFPGTNCEYDVTVALKSIGADVELVWHGDCDLDALDAVVLPGGFAHGDYLRPGAIARFSPIMDAVREFADLGSPVVGICNGFQVLTEAGLLPGALQKNKRLKFVCAPTTVKVCSTDSVLTCAAESGQELAIPVNHFSGSYVCDGATLKELQSEDRVVLRYVENPNGSIDDIAGVCNETRNVVGLMPHPERAMSALLGSCDGEVLFRSLLDAAVQPLKRGTPARASTDALTPMSRQVL